MRIIIAEELKKAKQKKNLVLSSVDYSLVADNYQFPLEGRIVLLFHLYTNLWGSKARYYHPSIYLSKLIIKNSSRKTRDYGSGLRFNLFPQYE